MARRAFIVAEANALIPRLEEILAQIERCKAEVREHYEKLQLLEALWGEKLVEPGNPDHAEFREHRDAVEEVAREIGRIVEEEILARGIRFPQGGLEHGLLDFPTTLEGRWVYLCWRSGEPRVEAWHEVDAGFAGRQPITTEHAWQMGREDDPALRDDSALDF
ncbi:MAG TPA: DUF2203 domain-containing protein [Longimicrobiaceae bacterium]|nr:DUF2203 domain-containing protein [Longimicrobiaceae bacterium]